MQYISFTIYFIEIHKMIFIKNIFQIYFQLNYIRIFEQNFQE